MSVKKFSIRLDGKKLKERKENFEKLKEVYKKEINQTTYYGTFQDYIWEKILVIINDGKGDVIKNANNNLLTTRQELLKIGINLNQLMKRLHTENNVTQEDILKVKNLTNQTQLIYNAITETLLAYLK